MEYTLTYSDYAKGWTSFFSYLPESMTSIGNNFYSFKNGQLYMHNQTSGDRNVFYGQVAANTEVEFVVNDAPSEIKMFKNVELEGDSGQWDATITTDLDNGHIAKESFVKEEGMYHAYVRRNSSDELNEELMSIQGIGSLVSSSGNVFTVTQVPSSLSIGDALYSNNGSTNTKIGVVSDKTATTITVSSVLASANNGDFMLVAKNPVSESYGLKGYYANIRLSKQGGDATELFAVNSEIAKSFP